MGSIPLPALDVRPPAAQPNPLEQYGNLLQLRAAVQGAPYRQQMLEQQAEAGAQENQIRAQQISDQKAMTAAMQSWDGKDLGQLVPLVVKNGGSATAVMGLKSKILEQQQAYAKIAADDATTGAKNLETMKGKNDLIAGAIGNVMQMPDERIGQGLVSTAQDLAQKGLIDPQHAQAAAQIAQTGNPAQIREQLGMLQKSYMGMTAQMDAAQKQTQIASEKANTAKTQAEADWYAKNGGAPGVPVEATQQADWLTKNPGKGPSDFLLWKLQHTPAAMMMGNQFAGPQNSQALDFVADNYRRTGQMPPELSRSPGTITAVIQRAAQMDQQQNGGGLAANSAEFKANSDSLKKLQGSLDAVTAFENTANKNIEMLKTAAQKIPDLGTRFANTPVRMFNASLLGDANMAAFKTALAPVQTEAAKILNSANLSGQLSDSSRHELQEIVDGNMPYKSLVASLGVLQQDFKNRHDSTQAQIEDIQRRIRGGGGGGMVTMRAPNGQTKQVPADQVDHYKSIGATVVQ